MRTLGGAGRPYTAFSRITRKGEKVAGKIFGPDGKQLIRVYGPHSAPTQHMAEYEEVMIGASGIGVTPLASCLKSIAHYRWKYSR
jgi:hypothetical protein